MSWKLHLINNYIKIYYLSVLISYNFNYISHKIDKIDWLDLVTIK